MAKPRLFTENGTVKPITPPKPRNRGAVVAVSLTLAIGGGSAGTTAALSTSGDVTVSTNAGRASSGSKGSARSRGRDRTGQDVVRRLERRGSPGRQARRVLWRRLRRSLLWAGATALP